jgi:high-affinity iron transporter
MTFSRNCALCHGAAGDGHGVRVSSLSSKPRDFTDHTWQQRTSDRHIFFVIREGVSGTAMPAWRGLSEEQTWELVAFIRALSTSVASLTGFGARSC